jgi:hypothetical protein
VVGGGAAIAAGVADGVGVGELSVAGAAAPDGWVG